MFAGTLKTSLLTAEVFSAATRNAQSLKLYYVNSKHINQ